MQDSGLNLRLAVLTHFSIFFVLPAIPYTENEVSSFHAPVNVILPLFRQFLKLEFSSPQEIPAK